MNIAEFIKYDDLFIAYRKVKVDLFYSGYYSAEAIIEYENNLEKNLNNLYDNIISGKSDWVKDNKFIGGNYYIPKSIDFVDKGDLSNENKDKSIKQEIYFTSPEKALENREKTNKVKAKFRLMSDVSLDFHILAELWILKIGHLLDSKLSDNSYGNRLRRLQNDEINEYSLGTFKPYLKAYRDWKNDALNAISESLECGKKLITLTGDISSFYHSLSPEFLRNEEFLNKIGVDFLEDQYIGDEKCHLHNLFLSALLEWQKKSPEQKGLPVGVPASSLIANVALWEFDKIINENITPIHYGRYVDDIILVMDNASNIDDAKKIYNNLCKYFNKDGDVLESNDEGLKFCPKYLEGSNIEFKNKKNKIFIMEGETGKSYVKSIQNEIAARSSEWRAMPNLDDTDVAFVLTDRGEKADNLRSAERLIIKKADFSIKLRNIENINRNLHPNKWEDTRHKFLMSCINNIFVLPEFFDYFKTIPRIIRLATVCEDFDILLIILRKCNSIFSFLKSKAECDELELTKFISYFNKLVVESIVSSFPLKLSKNGNNKFKEVLLEITEEDKNNYYWAKLLANVNSLQKKSLEYYVHDIGMQAFKNYFIGKENDKFYVRKKDILKTLYSIEKNESHKKVLSILNTLFKTKHRGEIPLGIIFATRPISLLEIYMLFPNIFERSNQDYIKKIIHALRGFNPTELPQNKDGILTINNADKPLNKVGIASACWKTEHDSWVASISQIEDPDIYRYARFSRIINDLLSKRGNCHYFIMPELSIPFEWFLTAALKLKREGISFIAGVEYFHKRRAKITNKVWASLIHDSLGFPSLMLYSQDKQKPALNEKLVVKRISNKSFSPDICWKNPPIIHHGDLFFSILICSELTNIAYRSYLRGKIDVLFIPAWNQDLETFGALVESAALDIHAYVVECNDRAYGDTRIRCPHKDSWARDIVRTKGGDTDYIVTATIDVRTLRKFQSSYDSPGKPFKPVPDGFTLSYGRTDLPLDD